MSNKPVYATTNNERPYQGYPYANPVITDAPTVKTNVKRSDTVNEGPSASTNVRIETVKADKDLRAKHERDKYQNASVFIDTSNDQIATPNDTAYIAGPAKPVNNSAESNPAIYIDIPSSQSFNEASSSNAQSNIADEDRKTNKNQINDNLDQNPVIYIDIPDRENVTISFTENNAETNVYQPLNQGANSANTSSNTSQNYLPINQITTEQNTIIQQPASSNIGDFVSETIFFDQFENRRINKNKPTTTGPRLNVNHRLPSPDEDFNLSPLPVNHFPEPPPAYSEIDANAGQRVPASTTVPRRTEVITNRPIETGATSPDRKLLTCQHCSARVRTVVIRQAGAATHFIALSCLAFCLFPITMVVYCTKWFKYKNHYCPNCSKLIGFEVPILCQELAFVDRD